MMSEGVQVWWWGLCAVAVINVVAWSVAARLLYRRQSQLPRQLYTVARIQLLLSAVYVSGCAFRSAMPVFDVPRLCIVNSWLSSVIVGRSVATVAELCFVAQWALLLRETSRATGSRLTAGVARLLVPLIAVAEICSWSAVLTTSNLGHVAEESLWGLAAGLLVVSLIAVWPQVSAARRPLLLLGCAVGVAYVGYMFLADVPRYWARWLADEATHRHYLGFLQGVHDVATRRVVSGRWRDWKGEMIWMSLYFSVAVWLSIALVHARVTDGRAAERGGRA